MRKTEKIDGFKVDAFPNVKGSKVEWVMQFRDLPFVRATGASVLEAKERLIIKWQKTAEAFKTEGLPVPEPIRPRGNKRTLDTIRRLAGKKWNPIF
jgi:predicted RNase H-like HicB family nuclease